MQATASLYVRGSGPAGAPVIVFLHGGGSSSWMWQPVMDLLPQFRCLAPDLPEHGQSRAVGPFSMALAAEKVADVLHANGGRATVVGLSEGAQVLVQLLASAPELVERALISSALLRPLPGMGFMANPGLIRWMYRLSVTPFQNSDAWIRLNMKYAAGIPETYYPQFKQDFQQTSESAFANLMVANQRFRLPEGLEKAAAPALVVVGSKEYRAMKQSARDLAAVLPNAKAVQVSLGKAGSLASEHNWALAAPLLFAQTVRAWIEDLPLPEALSPL
jgi:pimeloyl-ACP methyl ester carboxylesterase